MTPARVFSKSPISVLCSVLLMMAFAIPSRAQESLPHSDLSYIFSASIASDYVANGISQSGGNATFQPFFELDWRGFYGGLAVSYLQINRDRAEFDVYIGHRNRLANDIYFDISYRRFILNSSGDCCGDAKARVIFPVGESIRAELLLGFNDTLNSLNRRGRVLWEVSDEIILSGSYGETSQNDNQYWNIGVSYSLPNRLALNLRYEGAETGDVGLVATLGWSTVNNSFVRLFTNPFQ